jgi:hypothetical protein
MNKMEATNETRAIRIFLSSTIDDLVEFRTKVTENIQRLNQSVIQLETFGAKPGSPVSVCKELAASADLLIVVLAHKYGWIPSKEQGGNGNKSITWLEVEAADSKDIPVLAFLVNPDAPWIGQREQDGLVCAKNKIQRDAVAKAVKNIAAFRDYLSSGFVRDTFATPDELGSKVATSVSNWLINKRKSRTSLEELNSYLNAVINETDRINIRGIASRPGQSREAISWPIENLYTPLHALSIQSRDEEFEKRGNIIRQRRKKFILVKSANSIPLTEIILKRQKLLLVGKPGGGKTTFLRLVACSLAKNMLYSKKSRRRKKILVFSKWEKPFLPVFIRLSALAHNLDDNDIDSLTVETVVTNFLAEKYGQHSAQIIFEYINNGRAHLLLDGLDEVADTVQRKSMLNLLEAMIKCWGLNRITVTSRPQGYEVVSKFPNIATVTIDDLSDPQIRDFLKRWVHAIYPENEHPKRDDYFPDLEEAIIYSRAIRRLAGNPVMLTCLCVVHWNERRLPEGKAELLAAVLRWLINSREIQRKKRGFTGAFAEECFKELALAMSNDKTGKKVVVDLAWAAEQLATPFIHRLHMEDAQQIRALGMRFLEEEMLDSGIVEMAGFGRIQFWHLTFQEHYAAKALVERGDDLGEDSWWCVLNPNLFNRQWSEIIDHFAGCLVHTGWRRLDLFIQRVLSTAKDSDLVSAARTVGACGRILKVLSAYDYTTPANLEWDIMRERALKIFTIKGAAQVPLSSRIAAAEALGQGGDPRLGNRLENMLKIPGMDNVRLGKYPLTVEEFQCFIDDGGYKEATWWDKGWQYRITEKLESPAEWHRQIEFPSRPVVGVSWHECKAFCIWLSHVSGREYQLPFEVEWRMAAKNKKGPYPWGAKEPNDQLTSFYSLECDLTPVGVFPAGATPGGHLDMGGSIWEWCADDVSERFNDSSVNELHPVCGGLAFISRSNSAISRFSWIGMRSQEYGFRISLRNTKPSD